MSDHERIWLSPACERDRSWCGENVWDKFDHEDTSCDQLPTEYVRADLFAAARAEIERLKADAAREDAEGDRMLNERDEEISRLTLERDAAIRQAEHRHELQRTARQATLSECIRALEKLKEQP